MAGWCNSSSRWVQSPSWYIHMSIQCIELCISLSTVFCSFRQLFSLLRISQTSWRPSPRVGKWRRRSAWKKSENSSSTSPPLLMLFMRCTIRWMLILITQCDGRTLLFPPVIRSVYNIIYIPHSAALHFTHVTCLHMSPFRSYDCSLQSAFMIFCRYTSNVCTFNHLCTCSGFPCPPFPHWCLRQSGCRF